MRDHVFEVGPSDVKGSASSFCELDRKVFPYRLEGRRNVLAGTDIAQPNQDASMWAVQVSKAGSYQASVKAKKACAPAKSRVVASRLAPADDNSARSHKGSARSSRVRCPTSGAGDE